MIGLLDQLFARREAATVPSMDGVLRPNSALDQASIVATGLEPDNLVVLNGDLLFSSGGSATASSRTSRNGDGGGGGNAPLLFEHLGEVSGLENGERREFVDELGEIGHFSAS